VQITSDTKNGIAILRLSGRLIFDPSLLGLRDEIGHFLDSGINRFIFDVSAVPHCDSSGCGEIIGAYSSIRKAGGTLVVLNPTDRVRLLWERIKLTDIFPMFDRLEDAEAYVQRGGNSGQTNSASDA
jgi:anti-sigma B factor antagonist